MQPLKKVPKSHTRKVPQATPLNPDEMAFSESLEIKPGLKTKSWPDRDVVTKKLSTPLGHYLRSLNVPRTQADQHRSEDATGCLAFLTEESNPLPLM